VPINVMNFRELSLFCLFVVRFSRVNLDRVGRDILIAPPVEQADR
jgi:hypothetical protein